jgi:hypothetical protein
LRWIAEDDGRWIAEVMELAGVMCYGAVRDEAISKADRIAHGELPSTDLAVSFSIPDDQLASH